jgi:dephospho-CoA kinase
LDGMLNLKRVAVTGGIACGKSTVADVFQKLGARVVSADQIAHQCLSQNSQIRNQVMSLLGTVDRAEIAKIVFRDADLLHKLEAIIHPYVAQEILNSWEDVKNSDRYKLFVAEVPLLFEAKQETFYDAVVAVTCPEDRAIERVSYGRDEYLRRASMQLSQSEKANRANFIIENLGSIQELEAKATSLFKLLTRGEL